VRPAHFDQLAVLALQNDLDHLFLAFMIVSAIHADPTVMIPKMHVIITPNKKSAVSGVISCLLFYAFLKWDFVVIRHNGYAEVSSAL
jgi:hypothetical protein